MLAFLSGYSCMMGPLAGTIVCDYYLVRKRKLDIRHLYRGEDGIYWYSHGVNWRAMASFMLGFLPTLPGFVRSIGPNVDVGGAWKLYTFAWLFGFTVAVGSYWLICKFVSPPSDSLLDRAVLPPGKVDDALGTAAVVGGDKDSEKEEIVVDEKEDSPV
jgi:cytosine/uracil/thiamine/allantoin permease